MLKTFFIKYLGQNKNEYMETFKLGIDWHGVLDALPESLSWLTRAIVNNGGEVHIITGMTWTPECEEQLKKWDVKWTHHFSIFDHHEKLKTPVIGFHEKFQIPKISDLTWDMTKGEYCSEHNITLHLDDTLIYNEFFTTPFARLWTHNDSPKRPDKDQRHKD